MRQLSYAVSMLLASGTLAVKLNDDRETHPFMFHWNEDPNSVPDPMRGATQMTSTWAKYLRNGQTDMATEPKGINYDLFTAYNRDAAEPKATHGNYMVQLEESESESDAPEDTLTVLWRVTPDYGEKDSNVVSREFDIDNGKKASGWTNPLAWHDNGDDDDKVLVGLRTIDDDEDVDTGVGESGWITPADNGLGDERVVNYVQYDESEGPTKADNGDSDQVVVYRESDIKNGEKFSGWTNPLSWTDAGDADETVLVQQRYDESEGPTKADNGDSDNVVVYRESDIKNGEKFSGWTNPLSWTDAGDADETVV